MQIVDPSPDWSEISLAFDGAATTVNAKAKFDSKTMSCVAEACKVTGAGGKVILFPNIAKATDCVGKFVTASGTLASDWQVAYDPTGDVVTLDIDSEGLTVRHVKVLDS